MFPAQACAMPRYLISYDISDAKVRDKVALRLEKLGLRVQYSVFVLDCPSATYDKLVRDLLDIIGESGSLLCLPICEHCFQSASITGLDFPLISFF